MASPMQAPTRGDEADKASAMNPRNSNPWIFAICPIISPNMSEQNKPRAMWLRASTIYFLKSILIMILSAVEIAVNELDHLVLIVTYILTQSLVIV